MYHNSGIRSRHRRNDHTSGTKHGDRRLLLGRGRRHRAIFATILTIARTQGQHLVERLYTLDGPSLLQAARLAR